MCSYCNQKCSMTCNCYSCKSQNYDSCKKLCVDSVTTNQLCVNCSAKIKSLCVSGTTTTNNLIVNKNTTIKGDTTIKGNLCVEKELRVTVSKEKSQDDYEDGGTCDAGSAIAGCLTISGNTSVTTVTIKSSVINVNSLVFITQVDSMIDDKPDWIRLKVNDIRYEKFDITIDPCGQTSFSTTINWLVVNNCNLPAPI